MVLTPYIRGQRTLNERLVAAEIIRQVLLLRFSLHVRDLVVGALNATEQPIARMVRDALHTDAGLRDAAQVRELDRLIDQINAMRAEAWQSGVAAAEGELAAAAEAEPEEQRSLFAALLPGVALVLPGAVGAAALAAGYQGRTMRQWFADARTDEQRRVRGALYAGVGAGEDPATVARRVVGRASLLGADGATQTSRNHADTIIKSGVVHVTAYARDQFYRANEAARYVDRPVWSPLPMSPVTTVGGLLGGVVDPAVAEAQRQVRQALAAADARDGVGLGGVRLFLREQFVAVLDSRTTKLCRGLDGRRYRVGEGPLPPLHMNCRSNRVVVLPEGVGGPVYDPGRYGQWVRAQPAAVREALLGTSADNRYTEAELADAAFRDYGQRAMTLPEIRDELRRLLASY